MADAATEARINNLSGGAPLPQSDTATIAKRLLGPLADRYGDVIGIRPTGAADVARDFAIGALSGDPFKADQLKMQVLENYQKERRAEEDQLFQREQAAREQVNGFFELMKQGKTVPKHLRKEFFKETLPQIGIEPTSPLFLKILSSDENMDIYDALSDPALRQLMLDDPIAATEKMVAAGHDGALALGVAQQVQQMKRYSAETQNIIARTNRQNALTNQDPQAKARASFISRMAGRTVKDRLGRSRVLSSDEILAMADKFYPTGAPAGIPQEQAVTPTEAAVATEGAGIPQGTTTTTMTTSPGPTVQTTPAASTGAATAGIPQEKAVPAPTAEAGQQKVRRITGTVTRTK